MQKRRRWQLWVIFVVTVLTLYNIFPTIFYYTKPLKKPITAKQAEDISKSITKRVNVLEKDALDWTHSFCKLLDIKPVTLKMDEKNPQEILLSFSSAQEAKKLRTYLPKAGSLITFFPSQLSLVPQKEEIDSPDIRVQRKIPIRLEETLFTYVKKEESGRLTQEYKNILFDRVAEIALAIGGISENAIFLGSIQENPKSSASFELVYSFAGELINTLKALGENSPAGKRYLASITQGNFDKTASYGVY